MTTPSPLALVRIVNGLTQLDLAAQAGVSRNTIVNLERGHHRPRRSTAIRIGRVLGLDDPALVFPLNEEDRRAGNATASETRPGGADDSEE